MAEPVVVAHFSNYNPFLVILRLRIIIQSNTRTGFGISVYEFAKEEPPSVKVTQGQTKSYEVSDLG